MKYAGDTTRIEYEELTTLKVLKESHATLVSLKAFKENVDLQDYLDEDETLEDIVRGDPATYFYTIRIDDGVYWGFNSCGVDNLFSVDGEMPCLGGGLDSSLAEQCRRNQLAWVLSPCGSLLASGPMGEEVEKFRTDRFARFDGSNGSSRIHLLYNGEAISGIQIKNDKVEALYTHIDYTRRGFASQLFDFAYKMFPDLRHNESLTDDGKEFVGKYESRRLNKAHDESGFEP